MRPTPELERLRSVAACVYRGAFEVARSHLCDKRCREYSLSWFSNCSCRLAGPVQDASRQVCIKSRVFIKKVLCANLQPHVGSYEVQDLDCRRTLTVVQDIIL